MKDGTVAGNLSVKGTSTFQSGITALYGVDLGFDNTSVLAISAKRLAQLTGDLNIITGAYNLMVITLFIPRIIMLSHFLRLTKY